MVRAAELTRPDRIFHLGDGWRDAEALARLFPEIPLDQVPGNCDLGRSESAEKLLTVAGRRILLCHGHTLGVKYALTAAVARARERGADVLLFGHTHRPLADIRDVVLLNPGSIGAPRRPTYGLLELDGERALPSICELS